MKIQTVFKRPFFNLGAKPKLRYAVLGGGEAREIKDIPLPETAILWLPGRAGLVPGAGDTVRTGQKLGSREEDGDLLVSPVSGTVASVSPYRGWYGKTFTAISLRLAQADTWDEGFVRICREANLKDLIPYLSSLPGKPAFRSLLKPDPSMRTIIIPALDKDILISTSPSLLRSRLNELQRGIEHLRKITSARVVLAVPPDLFSPAETIGADIQGIKPFYPNAHPKLLARAVLGKDSQEGEVLFLSVESVIALNAILEKGEFSFNKVLTVVGKDLRPVLVRARIGTPVKDVLDVLNLQAGHGDKVILGGPMAGEVAYEDTTPVLADTDGIMVQGKDQILEWSDTHCINCGECVRVCPSQVRVNMLIRFLENGLYQEAADLYGLMDCIECGLCGYVCTARIPLFQYIMLGKHELSRKKSLEVVHG